MWTPNVSSQFCFYLYESSDALKGPSSLKMRKYLLTAMQLVEPSDTDFLCSLVSPFRGPTQAPDRREAGVSELASEVT